MSEPSESPTTLHFDFVKSGSFRVVHVDGAIGGPAPGTDGICMALYSERWPIPLQIAHEISADGKIGNEIIASRVSRDGVVREVEVLGMMSLAVAKALRGWLDHQITALENARGSAQRQG
jgi:hypothetical protein